MKPSVLRLSALCLLFCLLLCLTGCGRETLDRFFIVTAMAIDWEEGQYSVHLEGSADQLDENKNPKAVVRRGVGGNLLQCFLNVQKQTGEYPYLRHTELVLLSDRLTGDALNAAVDCLLNENGVQLNARVAACAAPAGDLLQDDEFQSQRILKAVTKGGGTLTSADIQLRDLAFTRLEDGIDSCLPATGPETTEGLRLLREDQWVGSLESRLVPAFLMAGGVPRGDGLTVEAGGQSAAFRLLSSRGSIETHMEGSVPVCTVTLKTRFRAVTPLGGGTARCEQALRQRLEQDLRDMLAVLQEAGCDALGIGQDLSRREPTAWAAVQAQWPEYFRRCRIVPRVTADIVSTGRLQGGDL